jgi:hypothetical protein
MLFEMNIRDPMRTSEAKKMVPIERVVFQILEFSLSESDLAVSVLGGPKQTACVQTGHGCNFLAARECFADISCVEAWCPVGSCHEFGYLLTFSVISSLGASETVVGRHCQVAK